MGARQTVRTSLHAALDWFFHRDDELYQRGPDDPPSVLESKARAFADKIGGGSGDTSDDPDGDLIARFEDRWAEVEFRMRVEDELGKGRFLPDGRWRPPLR